VSKYGAWIGGAIGWALGGPIGGILGFTFGKMFSDNSLSAEGAPHGTRAQTRPGDFSLALLVLSAAVMKADDKILKSELEFVKDFLQKNFGTRQSEQLILMLRDVLKQPINTREVAEQIRRSMDIAKRRLLVQYLYGIAKADGQIHTAEIKVIRQIAAWMAISAGDLASIEELYSAGAPDPYKVLEIDATATDSEVKKAYRKLAIKFHPDKVLDLGETHKVQARERFDAIQSAYEQIKSDRGFK
jgi:DnaJ like chaperone protein